MRRDIAGLRPGRAAPVRATRVLAMAVRVTRVLVMAVRVTRVLVMAVRVMAVRVTAVLAGAALAAGLAGCGSGAAHPGGGTSAAAGRSGSQQQATARRPADPLASSPLRVLTTLDGARLCSVLSQAQARRIMGTTVQAPVYGKVSTLGIHCRWIRPGTAGLGPDELYLGISTVLDWADARQADKLLQARHAGVDGHPALAAGPLRTMAWAQVDVALGGAHDPVAEFRAPTMAEAMVMARDGTEGVLARG